VISIWYFRQVGDVPEDKAEYYFRMVNPDFTTAPIYDSVQADAMKYPGPVSEGETPTPESVPPTPTEAQEPPTATSEPTSTTPPVEATSTPEPIASVSSVVTVVATGTVTPPSPTRTSTGVTPTTTAIISGAANGGGPNVLLFVLGGALVLAGLGGLAYLFVRNREGVGNT
jgi:hypothetical protein